MLLVGKVKKIGMALIETALLKKASISQDLWCVKDFASDLLVLKLESSKTVSYFLSVDCADPNAALVL